MNTKTFGKVVPEISKFLFKAIVNARSFEDRLIYINEKEKLIRGFIPLYNTIWIYTFIVQSKRLAYVQ
jgi:hypothetical protein